VKPLSMACRTALNCKGGHYNLLFTCTPVLCLDYNCQWVYASSVFGWPFVSGRRLLLARCLSLEQPCLTCPCTGR